MKVAIVAPFFVAFGGSSKVDQVFGELFPSADLFTLFALEQAIPESLRERPRHVSFLNRVPYIHKLYRAMIPTFPAALESLALEGYDLVLSSDHNICKGVLKDQRAVHICYCHTPWHQLYTFRAEAIQSVPVPLRPIFSHVACELRKFDYIGAQRVDHIVANSRYIAERIHACYKRKSTVIYPPVDTSIGFVAETTDDYYLAVGRLSHTKRLDLLIRTCNQLERRLVIVGVGRQIENLKKLAGPTIEFLGHVSNELLHSLYSRCRALVFAANEDFGIVPVEAQSFGRPVIAFGCGGSLETVLAGDGNDAPRTGIHFLEQTVESLRDAILRFEEHEQDFDPIVIQRHARTFDSQVFRQRMRALVESAVEDSLARM